MKKSDTDTPGQMPVQPKSLVKAVCTKCETIHTKQEGAESVVTIDEKPYVIQLCPKCRGDLYGKINKVAEGIAAEYMKPYIMREDTK